MKRIRTSRHARLTPRVETLVQLAESYALSCSRLEDAFWEKQLDSAIEELIADHNEEGLNAALDQLHGSNSRAYDMLADMVEAHCETQSQDKYEIQLICIPILAWSRFNIPASTIPAPTLEAVKIQLQAHVLSANARLSLANFLFSPDQLPQGFCPTAELCNELGQAALKQQTVSVDPAALPESMKFLSDTRYLVGAIAVEAGEPLFRWQEKDGNRQDAERNWQTQGGNALQTMLTGCATEFLLPLSYFAGCRDSDRASRPFSLQASVEFLKTTLDTSASQLRAVIAPFYEQDLEEYRIGFTFTGKKEVLYGLVWPLLEAEDDSSEMVASIEAMLREHGFQDILVLDHRLPIEYCDDCGSPLYPNPDGEIVHAELPDEQADAMPRHLH